MNTKSVFSTAGLLLLCLSTSFWVSTAKAQANINLRILPLGDSITAGYQSTTANGYRGPLASALASQVGTVDFVGSQIDGSMPDPDNEGHFGYEIDRLASLTNIALYNYKPNLVLLDAGINDLGNGNDVTNAPARLASLLDQVLASEPDATVLVAQLIVNATPNVESEVGAFNNQLATLVQARASAAKHVYLVDMSAVTVNDLADGLHPNDAGYQLMANAWDAGIQQVIAKNWITDPRANSATVPTGLIYSGIAGKCLDNANGSGTASNPVDLQDCNGGNVLAQQWNINNSTLAINGLCLDIDANGTAAGTLVDVWHCDNAPNQVWIVRNNAIINPASGRCLSEPATATSTSMQLDIEDCKRRSESAMASAFCWLNCIWAQRLLPGLFRGLYGSGQQSRCLWMQRHCGTAMGGGQ